MRNTTKVKISAGAGSLAAIIVWLLSLKGVTVPPGIETAIGVVVTVSVQMLLPNRPTTQDNDTGL